MDKTKFSKKEIFSFDDLVSLVDFLRSNEGCPWDRAQTHESIRNHFLEEAYEVCEGIDKKDDALLSEELGDMLFQILFHISLAKEKDRFTQSQVINGICKKMIFRHPSLFKEDFDSTTEERKDWEAIKREEKEEKTLTDSLSRISMALPALKRAEKFLKKGAENTYIETNNDPLLAKGEELFEIVRACTKENIDPEQALNTYLLKILDKMYNL